MTRSGIPLERPKEKLVDLPKWECSERRPTDALAERLAKVVEALFIRLYMASPEEIAPIPDFLVADGRKTIYEYTLSKIKSIYIVKFNIASWR